MNFNIDYKKIQNLKHSFSNLQEKNIIHGYDFDKETCEKIINGLMEYYQSHELTKEHIIILLTRFMQAGGSNKRAQKSIIVTSTDPFGNSIIFNAEILLKIIKSEVKNGTIRQLARSLAEEIVNTAVILELPGDLANQIKLEHPHLDNIELA